MQPGDMVGEYRIVAPIGRGGFGEVFSAEHPVIGKQVAIKVLSTLDHEAVRRFTAEATAVNRIAHPGIVDVFAFGQHEGRHYYVMELLRGASLERFLAERGSLPLEEALPILRAIAVALDAAHDAGFVHRDLKPDNIFLEGDGVKLIDFGLAKLVAPEQPATATRDLVGTPAYMAPEQCRGREVDRRTDIYALGVIAYRMLAGALPFEREDPLDTLLAHVHEAPRPPGIGAGVDAAILAMLAKDPDDRPATATAAIEALIGPAPRRGRAVWLAAGAALVAAAVAVIRVAANDPPAEASPPPREASVAPSPAPAIVPPPAAPITVHLVIESSVPAEAFLGDRSLGRTPATLDVERGARAEVTLRATGFATERRALDTSSDRTFRIELTPLRAARAPGPDDLEERHAR